MEDIDLPKSIVIECDFFLPGYDLLFTRVYNVERVSNSHILYEK